MCCRRFLRIGAGSCQIEVNNTDKGGRTRRRGFVRTGTAKASATSACDWLTHERSRGPIMVEDLFTLNACMLWSFRYS